MEFQTLDKQISFKGKGYKPVHESAILWYTADGFPRSINPNKYGGIRVNGRNYARPSVYVVERDLSQIDAGAGVLKYNAPHPDGRINLLYNTLHVDEDIYIPARRESTVKANLLELSEKLNELKVEMAMLGEKILHIPTLS